MSYYLSSFPKSDSPHSHREESSPGFLTYCPLPFLPIATWKVSFQDHCLALVLFSGLLNDTASRPLTLAFEHLCTPIYPHKVVLCFLRWHYWYVPMCVHLCLIRLLWEHGIFLCQMCLIPILRLKAIQTPELVGVLRAVVSSTMMGLKLLFIKWQSLDLQLPGTIAYSSFPAIRDVTTLLEAILGKWTSVVFACPACIPPPSLVLSFSVLVV